MDDDDCIHITDGKWKLGDPAFDSGSVRTVDPAGDLLPHQVRPWQYYSGGLSGDWQTDNLMTVIGNFND